MEENKIEIIIYRHKEYKDIYLIRNWSICGGCEDTEFYLTTHSLKEAINNMFRYNSKTKKDELTDEFMYWTKRFKNKLKVKVVLEKEMDFDGYKGKLKKELLLPVDDFEMVILSEPDEGGKIIEI